MTIGNRKTQHIDIVAEGRGQQHTQTTGFDAVQFEHVALPELDIDEISTQTRFLGKSMSAPLMVSAMTGGPERAEQINHNIAQACKELGLALAVGSQRIALKGDGHHGLARDLRKHAGNAPILGNIGAVQLNYGITAEDVQRAVDMIEADAMMLHLNPLQEAIQPEGDRNFSGLLFKIEALARALPVPLGAKEVGAGLSGRVASQLTDAGVTIIDVAGVGGTSWARVEAERGDARLKALAAPFHDWGIPTATAISQARSAIPTATTLIASGGVRHGLDVARSIRLGADLAGQAAGVLHAAQESAEAVAQHLSDSILQLKIALFCTGSRDLDALRKAPLISASNQ